MDQLYAYRFTDRNRDYLLGSAAHRLIIGDAVYDPVSISHTLPTFSSDPSQSRITVRLRESLQVAMNYISHPPPSKTELQVIEVLETEVSGNSLLVTRFEEHWSGQIVRIAWRDGFRVAEMSCRTLQEVHFSREALSESLNPLCRFHIGDGRCPVNIEDFKETVQVVDISDDISEPTIEVSGLSQADTYYKAGMIRTADDDWRTVDLAVTAGPNKVLTISRAFPSTSLQIGDDVDVFAGDDLTLETCATKFGAATNSGEAWGGWKLTPNRDFQRFGIR